MNDGKFGRREVLQTGIAAAGAAMLIENESYAEKTDDTLIKIIDTNVSLFDWPFRRLPLDETERLVERLRSLGVTSAWASSYEGLLHRDLQAVNERLAAECQQHRMLTPVGCINLNLPNWQDDFRRCVEVHRMPGLRLFPGYHDYKLSAPRFKELLALATEAKRFIQIAATMEDVRTQHPSLRAADVDLLPLRKLIQDVSGARVQILNSRARAATVQRLRDVPVYFDTARVDQTDGIPKFVKSLPAGRVLFGSHAPFLIPEAAMIRVHESGQLARTELAAIYAGNATRFIKAEVG